MSTRVSPPDERVVLPPLPPADAPSGNAPPPSVECALGALVADEALREAVLGDLAEGFAVRQAAHGPAQARRWYRAQAVRSAPALVAATWWPAPGRRAGRAGRLLAAAVGGVVLLQLLHQAAQLLATRALAAAGLAAGGAYGGPFPACSLLAGAGCAVFAGAVAARAVREAPLAGALALATACGTLAVTGMLVNGGATPLWYWGGLQLVVLPCGACAGGLLHARSR